MPKGTPETGNKPKIKVILTGGTICSSPNEQDKNQSDAQKAQSYIIADFKASSSPFSGAVDFDTVRLEPDILSENMTLDAWNRLLDILRDNALWTDYAGVIILHGTDTLAYTSALLSMVLAGAPIPVCMVSAQLPLMETYTVTENGRPVKKERKETRTNGYANFRASVELIMNSIAPNVYAVYRNVPDGSHEAGEFLVHLGSHLLQCPNYSNNFHSKDETPIPDADNAKLDGVAFETDTFCLEGMGCLKPDVLLLTPYVGLSYGRVDTEGLTAIVHGTYHSDTVCVERKSRQDTYGDYAILSLLDRCRQSGTMLFLAPCNSRAYAYDSTGDALEHGASFIQDTTVELAYVKTLVGSSLGLRGDDLKAFLDRSVNHEFVYGKSE